MLIEHQDTGKRDKVSCKEHVHTLSLAPAPRSLNIMGIMKLPHPPSDIPALPLDVLFVPCVCCSACPSNFP